jgi:tRNA(fMet)-specific endonuclease VapC
MNASLLDTDTLSEIIKGRDATVIAAAEAYLQTHGQFSLTSVSVYEILYGLGAKKAQRQIEKFLGLIEDHHEVVPTSPDYRLAAEIRAALHRSGNPIGNADPIIAACAIGAGLPLVTGNQRHYTYIVEAGFDLALETWRGS